MPIVEKSCRRSSLLNRSGRANNGVCTNDFNRNGVDAFSVVCVNAFAIFRSSVAIVPTERRYARLKVI